MSWSLPATAHDLREDNRCRSSRQLVDPPSSLRCRPPFQSETALAEANSFPSGCQPFCSIQTGSFPVRFVTAPTLGVGLADNGRLHNV